MLTITPIRALRDNYIWMLKENGPNVIIVDPGEAKPVLETLDKNQLMLSAIFITHHHWDHTNGISEIQRHYPCKIYASKNEKTMCDYAIAENDKIALTHFSVEFRVIDIPGHTLGHIAYVTSGILFSGDTLFTAGCGRVFEGDAKQMYHSLTKLKALPKETLIYCGHEYTAANLQFAEMVEPENLDIKNRITETNILRRKNKPTVPAPLSLELKTNPFLRCEIPAVIKAANQYAGSKLSHPYEVLHTLREWKNNIS